MTGSRGVPQLSALPGSVRAAVQPVWLLDDLAHRACPVCEKDEPTLVVYRPDRLGVSECQNCGVLYVADCPSEAAIADFYSRYASFKGIVSHRLRRFRSFRTSAVDPIIEMLKATGGIGEKSVCEIGCSYGVRLQEVRQSGGDVYGVELDIGATTFLESVGIPSGPELPDGRKFDVVMMCQVIEHMRSPSASLSRVSVAMLPDARLFIAVPNGGEAKTVGPRWVGYRVDLEHLNYFDVRSLSYLLSRHSLEVEQYWEYSQPGLQRSTGDTEPDRVPATHRLWRAMKRGLGLSSVQPCEAGKFVLAVLARKTS